MSYNTDIIYCIYLFTRKTLFKGIVSLGPVLKEIGYSRFNFLRCVVINRGPRTKEITMSPYR